MTLFLPTPEPRLAVVVGTLNRLDLLKICIESVRTRTQTPHVIYVTDAGSTDGTIEYLSGLDDPAIKPILVGKKLGQAKAYNDVFRTLSVPYVVWLSDDNEILPGALDEAVGILDRDRRIGMVGLKTRDIEGPFVDAPYIGGVSQTGVLNVNQGMLRTKVLADVGYFSEVFGFYGIDPDLTAKVLYRGHDIVYTKAVAIYHRRGWPVDRNSEQWRALNANQQRGLKLYEKKYGRRGATDPRWLLKRAFWRVVRNTLWRDFSIHDKRRTLGLIARDWNNIFNSRHISALDGVLSIGRRYHLRQRAPWLSARKPLPPDPVEATDGN